MMKLYKKALWLLAQLKSIACYFKWDLHDYIISIMIYIIYTFQHNFQYNVIAWTLCDDL